MRRSLALLTCLSLTALLIGCSDPKGGRRGGADDGIEVGNGAIRHHLDTDHKFFVTLPPGVRASSPGSGETLILGDGDSKMRLKVYERGALPEGRVRNLNELRAIASRACAPAPIETVRLHGTPGFTCRSEEGGTAWLLTPRSDVILVQWRTSGLGTDWPAGVLGSFVFDDAPPAILRLETEPSAIPKGRSFKLLVKALDDSAGLVDHVEGTFFPIGGRREHAFRFTSRLVKAEGEGWHQASVSTLAHLPSGRYCLESLVVRDRLANTTSLSSLGCPTRAGELMPYRRNGAASRLVPPAVELRDAAARNSPLPSLESITFERRETVAGGVAVIRFRLAKGVAGLRPTWHSRLWGEISPLFEAPPSARIALSDLDAQALDDSGAYRIVVPIPSSVPGGTYRLRTFLLRGESGAVEQSLVADGASASGYRSMPPSLAVPLLTVTASPRERDTEPPRVKDLYLVTPRLSAVDEGILLFHAEDDVSGIPTSFAFAGKWTPLDRAGPKLVLSGGVRPLGNGWHSLSFRLPMHAAGGRYFLEAFRVTDRAGNAFVLKGDLRADPRATFARDEGAGRLTTTPIGIPVLTLRSGS